MKRKREADCEGRRKKREEGGRNQKWKMEEEVKKEKD
jgi:hypothetical protein